LIIGKINEIIVNPEEPVYGKYLIRDLAEPVKFIFKVEPLQDPFMK
jgi:hypothetical protein